MNRLMDALHYHFKNPDLLREALTHPSVSSERVALNYERLEFLGDSVLGLAVAEFLLLEYPHEVEGDIARRHAALVCGQAVSDIARALNLGEYMIMTDGEQNAGGRQNAANLENTLEAIIGALYLDGGLVPVQELVRQYWHPRAATMKEPPKDPKTALQEWAQGRGRPIPVYRVIDSQGPSHAPVFTIQVEVEGCPSFQAQAGSKRIAEREAAQQLLSYLIAEEGK